MICIFIYFFSSNHFAFALLVVVNTGEGQLTDVLVPAAHLADHDRVGHGHDGNRQEEQHDNDERVIDTLGRLADLRAAVVVRVDQRHWPAHVVAVAFDKVRPLALRVRAIHVAGRANGQTRRPDEPNAHECTTHGERALGRQWTHHRHEALQCHSRQRQHTRHHAHHLHVRVDLFC